MNYIFNFSYVIFNCAEKSSLLLEEEKPENKKLFVIGSRIFRCLPTWVWVQWWLFLEICHFSPKIRIRGDPRIWPIKVEFAVSQKKHCYLFINCYQTPPKERITVEYEKEEKKSKSKRFLLKMSWIHFGCLVNNIFFLFYR